MKTSNEGKVEIIGHEGIALSKYKDSVGVWTIAGGATKTEIPDLASWPLDKKITMQEAFDLFGRSIVKYEDAINKALTRPILQTQFDALVSWCYNVGTGWAKSATVIKLLNEGVTDPIALRKALLLYRKPPEILGRRIKEADLLAYGKYSNGGKAMLFPVSSNGYPMYSRGTSINVWQYIPHTTEAEPIPPTVYPEEEKTAEVKPSLLQRIIIFITEYLEKSR